MLEYIRIACIKPDWCCVKEVKALTTKETDILFVDDDEDLSAVTADFLEDSGFCVECRTSGGAALQALNGVCYRLLILDINLPDMTGFELCQRIRKATNIPILIVSARTSDTDRITGLDLGGDDYIAKPYSLKELLARVKANLRRSYHMEIRPNGTFYFGDVCVESQARKVTKNGRPLELSTREFDLLDYLIAHRNEALSKEKIFNSVWGEESLGEISTLTVHIRWLREKIENDPSHPRFIQTVWGVGYRFEVE